MTEEQQHKAVGYALVFLRSEIDSLKQFKHIAKDATVKDNLNNRLRIAEEDYKMFQKLDEKFGLD